MTKRKKIIDARLRHNPDPAYAVKVIATIRAKGLKDELIADLAGIEVRTVYRVMERGFIRYPMQYILEDIAGLL